RNHSKVTSRPSSSSSTSKHSTVKSIPPASPYRPSIPPTSPTLLNQVCSRCGSFSFSSSHFSFSQAPPGRPSKSPARKNPSAIDLDKELASPHLMPSSPVSNIYNKVSWDVAF